MSGKVTLSVVGENGEETVIPVKSWSMNLGGSLSAASFGPGSKTWTIPLTAAPRFQFGDVVRTKQGHVVAMILCAQDAGEAGRGAAWDCLILDPPQYGFTWYSDELELVE